MGRMKRIIVVLVLLSVYLVGALVQMHLQNYRVLDREGVWWYRTDQGAYMEQAKLMYETNYQAVLRRNRMPIYTFLQSLIYDPALTPNEYFIRGKYFNILLSVILLALTYRIFRTRLPLLESRTLLLVVGFTVFVYKAGYFQAELLFYFLSFCTFLLFWMLFRKPTILLAIAAGLVAALAHLTKAAILPTVILFLFFFTVQQIVLLFSNSESFASPARSGVRKTVALRMITAGILVLVFLTTLYPYISTSKRIFGSYFYNVNTTFYAWYDSWPEARNVGTFAYGDHYQWPNMDADRIPGPLKYWREHSLGQILWRLTRGVVEIPVRAVVSTGYLKYLFLYSVFIGLLAIQHRHVIKKLILDRRHLLLVLFLVFYFGIYVLAFAWNTPIDAGRGVRHQLMLFLPAMFTMMYFLTRDSIAFLRVRFGQWQVSRIQLHQFVLCLLMLDVVFDMPTKLAWVYWGK